MPNNLLGSGNQLDASVNTIIAEFHILRDETGVMRRLARRLPLKPHEGPSKYVNNYSRLTAYALSDGVDLAQAQALADTQTSYTPAEVGVQVVVADTTIRRIADPALMKQVGQMMAMAYDRKEDQDGCTAHSSWTNGLGSAGTVLSVGHCLAGVAQLRVGQSNANPEPAPEPIYMAFHPCQVSALLGRLIPLSRTTVSGTFSGVHGGASAGLGPAGGIGQKGEQILYRGREALGSLFGVPLYDDANFSVDGSDDAVGAVFSKEGFIYVPEIEPTDEIERDPSLRAREVNLVGAYVYGRYRPANYGKKMTFDASLPTS